MWCARILRSGVLVLVLVPTLTWAQTTTPDFSGDWVLASLDAAVDVPRELRVQVALQGGTEVFRVERRGLSGTRTAEYRVGIRGGVVTGTQHALVSASWLGQQLVIRQGNYAGPLGDNAPFTETQETWSLDSSGRLVISITTRERGVAPKTTQATYRRR